MNKSSVVFLAACGIAVFAFATFYALDLVPAAGSQSFAPVDSTLIDVNKALAERVLGNPGAKIRIAEHSSLTCPHCAHFHKETFDQVKKQWIDTGKAYLAFSDFPLNAPALQASMVARCLPEQKYFDFIALLYKNQDDWAYKGDYTKKLQDLAASAGMDEKTFNACIASKPLQEGIIKRMNTVQTMWKVSSTPSFVINNKTVINGALPYDAFSAKLQDAVKGQDAR